MAKARRLRGPIKAFGLAGPIKAFELAGVQTPQTDVLQTAFLWQNAIGGWQQNQIVTDDLTSDLSVYTIETDGPDGLQVYPYANEFSNADNYLGLCGNLVNRRANVWHVDPTRFVTFSLTGVPTPSGTVTAARLKNGSGDTIWSRDPLVAPCDFNQGDEDNRHDWVIETDPANYQTRAGGTVYPLCAGGDVTFTNETYLAIQATVAKTDLRLTFFTEDAAEHAQRAQYTLSNRYNSTNALQIRLNLVAWDFGDITPSTDPDPCWQYVPSRRAGDTDPLARLRVTDGGTFWTWDWDLIWETGSEPLLQEDTFWF